jgi:hypothetical protein
VELKLKVMTRALEWAERVSAWRASGKSAAEFCEKGEYSAKSLQWWSSQLKRRGDISTPRVALARVERQRQETAAAPEQSIVIAVGEARVEVPAGADRAALMLVLEALRELHAGARR